MDLSKSLGLSKKSTFIKVILPLSISGIFSGIILVIMKFLMSMEQLIILE